MRETKIPYLKAGEVITEGWLNAIVDRIERFRNLSTASPYIRLWDGPYGKSIALALPQQTWARLSGSTSPYSFVEVRDGPSGTWDDMPNGDSGSANVYEVNGKPGLSGKVVPIHWTAAGDWRFQWVGYGCVADANHICVCDCPTPYPKSASIGDDNGTHVMTQVSNIQFPFGVSGFSTTGWGVSVNVPDIVTYSTTAGLQGVCSESPPRILTYDYFLTYKCSTSQWMLIYAHPVCSCRDTLASPFAAHYGDLGGPGVSQVPYAAEIIPLDCDNTSMLVFDVPTSFEGLATFGGGGTLTVVF